MAQCRGAHEACSLAPGSEPLSLYLLLSIFVLYVYNQKKYYYPLPLDFTDYFSVRKSVTFFISTFSIYLVITALSYHVKLQRACKSDISIQIAITMPPRPNHNVPTSFFLSGTKTPGLQPCGWWGGVYLVTPHDMSCQPGPQVNGRRLHRVNIAPTECVQRPVLRPRRGSIPSNCILSAWTNQFGVHK